jgi:beta-ureidopropionase
MVRVCLVEDVSRAPLPADPDALEAAISLPAADLAAFEEAQEGQPKELKQMKLAREICEHNTERAVQQIAAAGAAGVRILCLGELFPAPYFALDFPLSGSSPSSPFAQLGEDVRLENWIRGWRLCAEPIVTVNEEENSVVLGPTVGRLAAAAKEHGVVVAAPIFERDDTREGDARFFNTAVVISEKGALLGKYRKCHIPHGANEKGSFLEKHFYGRSDGNNSLPAPPTGHDGSLLAESITPKSARFPFFPVFETTFGRIGVAICYDRHFEGSVRSLAHGGAQIVLSPAVTFGAKSERMWKLEFLVDAARNRVYIGGINRRGSEPPFKQEYFGDSHFAGPDGERMSTIAVPDRPELIVCDLDLGILDRGDPSGWNLQRDAREIHAPCCCDSDPEEDF